jgi:DNA-binding response OmpR family regulator
MVIQSRNSSYNNFSVLVIDDDVVVTRIVQQLLSTMGFTQVELTSKAELGLDLILDMHADGKPFDLVICDWKMPELTGIQILKKIREQNLKLAFIMLTANTSIDAIKDAGNLGVDAFIAKPFTSDEVMKKVRTVVNRINK